MIEVFKTNVCNVEESKMLKELIEKTFDYYLVNFDLQDCDRILRVRSDISSVNSQDVIKLMKGLGFCVEVLLDEVYPTKEFVSSNESEINLKQNSNGNA